MVTEKFEGFEVIGRYHTSCGWELEDEGDDTEEVDVGVVYGEVDEHGSRSSVDPMVLFQQT